jgi:hypothetical protein
MNRNGQGKEARSTSPNPGFPAAKLNGVVPSDDQPALKYHNAPEDLLDSWKEIALYLGREVRTVQRWEKSEYLPVHRHIHQKNGSIYAFKEELDAWRNGRSLAARPAPVSAAVSTQLVAAKRNGNGQARTSRGKASGKVSWKWVEAGGQTVLLCCFGSHFVPFVLHYPGSAPQNSEEFANGMGYPGTRGNRPELRNQFVRER